MEKNQIEGYGFHPTNEELTGHYLRKKRLDPDFSDRKITEINIYDYEPSELPGLALFQLDAPFFYFFVALGFKYANSKRVHRRTTRGGTWKVTGKERDVKDSRTKKVIGSKRTLVFYNGHTTSKDARTNWVMHEYRCKPDPLFKGGEFVVVRIKIKPNNWYDSSTPNESVPSHHLTSDSGDHFEVVSHVQTADIIFSKESQLQPNHPMTSDRHRVTKNNVLLESQPQPNHDISFNRESQPLPNHDISFNRESQLLPNYNYNLSPVLPYHDISLNREFQLLPNQSLYSDTEDPVRKNTTPEVEVEPHVPAVGLDQDTFSTQQTQIHLQQQQQVSSHSCGFSGVSNVSNSPLGSEQENDWINNSEWTVQFQDDTIHALLKGGFSPMAYGENDVNSLFEPQSYPAVDENIVPVQMGSVV